MRLEASTTGDQAVVRDTPQQHQGRLRTPSNLQGS